MFYVGERGDGWGTRGVFYVGERGEREREREREGGS